MQCLLLFAALITLTTAFTPGKIKVVCGDWKTDKPARITYRGDAKAVFALPPTGKPCKFIPNVATASYYLDVYYTKKSGRCYFMRTSPKRDAYCIRVESRMTHEDFEGSGDEQFLIECAYMAYKEDVKAGMKLLEPYKAMKTFLYNKGKLAKSHFTVKLIDVDDSPVISAIPENHVVRILAHMNKIRGSNEVGFLPLECVAKSVDGKVKITILADGCGTGYPWKKTEGFQMKGVDGTSPYFKAFKFVDSPNIIIGCSFVACTVKCDENTCSALSRRLLRSRRNAHNIRYDIFGMLSSENQDVVRAETVLEFTKQEWRIEPGNVILESKDDDSQIWNGRDRHLVSFLLVAFGVMVAVISLSMLCFLMRMHQKKANSMYS